MSPGSMAARSIAARAATAPRSIADTLASRPPGGPSPRLPPIHSAIGVRAPAMSAISAFPLLDTGLLLGLEKVMECSAGPTSRWRDGALDAGSDASRAARVGQATEQRTAGTNEVRGAPFPTTQAAPACRACGIRTRSRATFPPHESQDRIPGHERAFPPRVREHHV